MIRVLKTRSVLIAGIFLFLLVAVAIALAAEGIGTHSGATGKRAFIFVPQSDNARADSPLHTDGKSARRKETDQPASARLHMASYERAELDLVNVPAPADEPESYDTAHTDAPTDTQSGSSNAPSEGAGSASQPPNDHAVRNRGPVVPGANGEANGENPFGASAPGGTGRGISETSTGPSGHDQGGDSTGGNTGGTHSSEPAPTSPLPAGSGQSGGNGPDGGTPGNAIGSNPNPTPIGGIDPITGPGGWSPDRSADDPDRPIFPETDPTEVPEPMSVFLIAMGVLTLELLRIRRRKRRLIPLRR